MINIDSLALDFKPSHVVAVIAGGFEVHEVETDGEFVAPKNDKELVGAGA
jgi:hypothetical protein